MSKRLFVAIDLPDSTRQLLAGLDPRIRGVRWTQTDHMHLTIGFFEGVPENVEPKMRQELSRIGFGAFFLNVNGVGVFQGFDITARPPDVGDIIQNNRRGNKFDFAFARTHTNYESHSTIVVEIGHDNQGGFAFCVGGNESDSVRRSVVRLDSQGFIKQRDGNPFICIVKDLK